MKHTRFKELKKYGSPVVYFCEHEMKHSCIVAIPAFSWSFLIDYAINDTDEKPILAQSLTRCFSENGVEAITDAFYEYWLKEFL